MTRALLDDRFAPITWSPGFLKLPLDDFAKALVRWRYELGERNVSAEQLVGFPDCLRRLEPLVSGARPRVLVVEMRGGWTAYFDCGLNGTDAESTVNYLADTLGTWGVLVRNVRRENAGTTGDGSVQFELIGPERTEWLNTVRVVTATHTDDRWYFGAEGAEQPFEEPAAYAARRVRDRFTSEMLERYCQALGIDVFNPAAYGPRAVLVSVDTSLRPEQTVLSLADAQRRLRIAPYAGPAPGTESRPRYLRWRSRYGRKA